MQIEKELIRNFCPYCQVSFGYPIVPLTCPKCGTEDLIPNPENAFPTPKNKFNKEEAIEIPKSKLELDQNAVNKLLNDDWGFLCGLAGSGKSTLITEVNRLYPHLLEIVATTGIAGVNLGTKTINSTLKYFDTKSLENAWQEQKLHFNLRLVRSRKSKLLIDEASMLDAEQLNLIVNAIDDINSDGTGKRLGLWLCGDLCFGIGTKIMMADGTSKNAEKIIEGDRVMGVDSCPRLVLRTTSGQDNMFRVIQTNGDNYVVNSKHQIVLKRSASGKKKMRDKYGRLYQRYTSYSNNITISAEELSNKARKFRECFVGYKAGIINFDRKDLEIEPYFLGLWLGDGDKDCPRITTADKEILDYCTDYATSLGLHTTIQQWKRTDAIRIYLSTKSKIWNGNPIRNFLQDYKLINNKHIPSKYLYNTEENRLELLAGLLDSDGCWAGNRYSITLTKKKLIHQIKKLADLLGFRASIRQSFNIGKGEGIWTVTIGGDTWRIPCKIARKKSIPRDLKRTRLESMLKVVPIGNGEYVGFEVDGDNMFLLADGTVAHNCQLAPIKAKYIFHSDYWDRFERNTVKLTKVWRQDNLEFMRGINLIRASRGKEAMEVFKSCGVNFIDKVDDTFKGTTLIPKNDEVDAYNLKRLHQISETLIRTQVKKRGKQLSEWEKNIPFELRLKKGAFVMILSNDIPEFTYVNGDTGTIEDYNAKNNTFSIKLTRNGNIVQIGQIMRKNIIESEPASYLFTQHFTPYNDYKTGDWIIGDIQYHPLRLAYASTLHKSQGLSLDLVQIDTRHSFFSAPSMAYVGISRARTPSGLYLVGKPEIIANKISMSKEVEKYV